MTDSLDITRLKSGSNDFGKHLDGLLNREDGEKRDVHRTVEDIIRRVRLNGDAALLDLTRKLDGFSVTSETLEVTPEEMEKATASLSENVLHSLEQAALRIRRFHEKEKAMDWSVKEKDGSVLGQRISPLERVGIYVPGGKAAYPSSVLMNAIPASVAGVDEIIMVAPTPAGEDNPVVLAAAQIAGVHRVFRIGGAQAVAALAWGTAIVPKVDKVVGPGNIYVATAKKMVFGQVGIDMIAGPSEVVVIADDGANPRWVALDLFAQAEHDERAQAILISPCERMINEVAGVMNEILPTMDRADVIRASITSHGALIQSLDLNDAVGIANQIAPEHLELMVSEPKVLLQQVRHAGAIFCGYHSAESLGDYCAGPNHVLPTSGTARFSSPLGVYDFQKRSSVIDMTEAGARGISPIASTLAEAEGLHAHMLSAQARGNPG